MKNFKSFVSISICQKIKKSKVNATCLMQLLLTTIIDNVKIINLMSFNRFCDLIFNQFLSQHSFRILLINSMFRINNIFNNFNNNFKTIVFTINDKNTQTINVNNRFCRTFVNRSKSLLNLSIKTIVNQTRQISNSRSISRINDNNDDKIIKKNQLRFFTLKKQTKKRHKISR